MIIVRLLSTRAFMVGFGTTKLTRVWEPALLWNQYLAIQRNKSAPTMQGVAHHQETVRPKTKFRLYPYQFTVQLAKSMRHGSCEQLDLESLCQTLNLTCSKSKIPEPLEVHVLVCFD